MTGQPSSYNCKNGCKFHKTQNCPAYLCDKTMICIVGCASHSAFSIPPEGATPENECFCVSKCDPKNCGTALCKCSECWNPATSLGCDGNWQTAHNAAIAQAAREEAREEVPGKILFKRVFKMPRQFPSIKRRVIAFKDFETDGDESWNTISNSPTLEDGDVILILRQPTQKKEVPE